MNKTDEYEVRRKEAKLLQNAETVIRKAQELVLEGVISDEEAKKLKEVADEMLKNLDWMELFEGYLKIAVAEYSNNPECEELEGNMWGPWIKLTKAEAEEYARLSGEEQKEFVHALYYEKMKAVDC